jgi:hypothetical protein
VCVYTARQLQLEASGSKLIDKLDLDGDGEIDRVEYLIGILSVLEIATPEQ